MLLLVATACAHGLECGDGTTEQDGQCVAAAIGDSDTSEAPWSCPEDLPSDDAFDDYAPVVVCTVPRAGDAAVDPALAEIRAAFSKDMEDGSWSWVQVSERTFPETTGDPFFDGARTAVLPVALEADQTYVLWLNTEDYVHFRDEVGNSAVPFQWTFRTAAE